MRDPLDDSNNTTKGSFQAEKVMDLFGATYQLIDDYIRKKMNEESMSSLFDEMLNQHL